MVNKKYIGKSLDEVLKEKLKDPEFKFYFERAKAVRTIAEFVYMRRKKVGLTQAQLAKKAKTSQTVIARLESGNDKRIPSLDLLQRIAYALEVKLTVSFESKKAA